MAKAFLLLAGITIHNQTQLLCSSFPACFASQIQAVSIVQYGLFVVVLLPPKVFLI
jgi:hypothetical protein